MKKHLIFLLVAGLFAFTSCSDDDDATAEFSVIGTWDLESTNLPIPGLNPDACPNPPQITFYDDGTADWTYYSEDNNCEAESSSASWQHLSGDEYSITIPDIGTFEGTVTFESATKFTYNTSYELDASTSVPVQFTFVK